MYFSFLVMDFVVVILLMPFAFTCNAVGTKWGTWYNSNGKLIFIIAQFNVGF
jgi:hypothetical protein